MSIEVGSKVQGKVTGITNFGAFVELPDKSTGLVHISEVADNSEIVPKITPSVSVCLYFTQYIFHLVRFGTRFGTRVPCFICKSGESYQCHPHGRHFSKA